MITLRTARQHKRYTDATHIHPGSGTSPFSQLMNEVGMKGFKVEPVEDGDFIKVHIEHPIRGVAAGVETWIRKAMGDPKFDKWNQDDTCDYPKDSWHFLIIAKLRARMSAAPQHNEAKLKKALGIVYDFFQSQRQYHGN